MKKMYFVLLLAMFATIISFAQSCGHGSMHSGSAKKSPTNRIEFVSADGMIIAYLLNEKGKRTTIEGATATATLLTEDGKMENIMLIGTNNEYFMYTLDKTKKYSKAMVAIKSSGNTASGSFDLNNKGAKEAPQEDHSGHHH